MMERYNCEEHRLLSLVRPTNKEQQQPMDPVSIAQILNPFLQTVFIVVIGLGY